MKIELHVWKNIDHLLILKNVKKTFEIVRSEITFLMDLYRFFIS